MCQFSRRCFRAGVNIDRSYSRSVAFFLLRTRVNFERNYPEMRNFRREPVGKFG